MALRIDKVQLQFDIKPNYEAQQLNKLKEDLSKANEHLKELEESRKSIEKSKPKKSDTQAWAEYQKKLDDVNREILQQRTVVDRATKAVEEQKQKMGLEALTLKELQNELKRYNAILANLQPGTDSFNETKKHIDDIKSRMKELKTGVSETKTSFLNFMKSANVFGFAFINVTEIVGKLKDWVKQGAQAWWDYNKQLAESARLTREFLNVTGGELEAIRADILATAETWDKDYKEVLKTVDYLMAQYQLTAQEAMRVVNDGFVAGADLSGDMLSKIQRYAPAFHDAGVSAQQLVGFITQTRSGIFTDQGMALMEMAVKKIREMSDQTRQSLENIGISEQQVAERMEKEGIVGVVRLISSEIKKLSPDSQQVGDVLSDVFGRQGTAGGYQMVAALETLDVDLDHLKLNTGEYGQLLQRQQEVQSELNEVTAQLFGISENGFENIITKVKTLCMEWLVAIIDYCRDIYDELATVRVAVEAVRMVFDTAFKLIEAGFWIIIDLVKLAALEIKGTAKMIEGIFTLDWDKVKEGWQTNINALNGYTESFAEHAADIGNRWGNNFIDSASRVIHGRANELEPQGNMLDEVTVTAKRPKVKRPVARGTKPTGNRSDGKNNTQDTAFQTDLAALEQNRRQALNILKQSLIDGQTTEQEYQQEQTTQQMAYLQAKLQLEKKYGKDTTDTESQILDLTISEANKRYQQQIAEEKANDQARLQERKQLLDEMQQAEKDALDKASKAKTTEEADSFFAEAQFQNDLMYSLDLISFEDYEKRKTEIADAEGKKRTELEEQAEQRRQQIRDAFAQQAQQLMQSTSSLFSALQSREESRVDKKYKALIAAAKKQGKDTTKLEEQQEAEKLAIQKKYADKQFAMTVLQIIAQTALGIQKIWAEWGWNPPVAIGLTATTSAVGAVQLATAKAQRDQAAGLYKGGYNDEAEGYTGDGNPKDVAGFIPVHKREFVINHEALQVPAVRRVADVIDSMQKRRAYSMQDTTAELQQAVATGGLARGGYNQGDDAQQSVTAPSQVGISTDRMEELMERNNALLDEMIASGITILELRRQIRRQEQLERNASR